SIISDIAQWFFITSLKATVVIALIMIFRLLFRDRLPARWQHALWFLLIIRLILPNIPSPLSLFNLTQNIQPPLFQPNRPDGFRQEIAATSQQQDLSASPVHFSQYEILTKSQPSASRETIDTNDKLVILWCIGIVLLFGYAFLTNIRLLTRFKRAQRSSDVRLLSILKICQQKLSISAQCQIYLSDQIKTPLSHGMLTPRIILSAHLHGELSDSQLEHIFLHELAHFKRRDLLLATLTTLLQIVYWFNPAVWFAFYVMRQDRESACDEIVLKHIGARNSHHYGQTLISLLRNKSHKFLQPLSVGLSDDKSNLKRRILMIANFSKKSGWWSVFAVVLMVLLSALLLTNASCKKNKFNVTAKIAYNGSSQPDSAWVGIYAMRQSNNKYIYSMGEPLHIVKCDNQCQFDLAPGLYTIAAWAWNYDRGHQKFAIVDENMQIDFKLTLDQQYIFGEYKSVHLYGDFNSWTHGGAPVMTKVGNVYKITPPDNLEMGAAYKFLFKLKEPIGHISYQNVYSPDIPQHRVAASYCTFDHIYDGRDEIVFDPTSLSLEEANPQITFTGGTGYEDELQTIYSDISDVMQNSYDTIMHNENLDPNEKFAQMLAAFDELKKRYNPALSIIIDEMMLVNAYHYHPFSSVRRQAYKNGKIDSTALRKVLSSQEFKDFAQFIKSMHDKIDMASPFFQGETPSSNNFLYVDQFLEEAPTSVQNELELTPDYFQNKFWEFIKTDHPARANIVGTLLRFYMEKLDKKPAEKEKALALIQILKNDYPQNWYTTSLVPSFEAQLQLPIGAEAPSFKVTMIDGKSFDLSSYRGTFIFLDFWGTWCGPCRGEIPNNIKLTQNISSDSLVFLGLALDKEKDLLDYVKEEKIEYSNAILSEELATMYGITAYPTTFLIDPSGNILAKNLRGARLVQLVRKKMDEYYEQAAI
ncbi:redoxin domain-containing protein, partial [candidate division KSB1 bacterium]|nr:redoxin domain-containing protein [candidate division KSB1 bacterium]